MSGNNEDAEVSLDFCHYNGHVSLLVCSRTLFIISNYSHNSSFYLFQLYEPLNFCLIRLMQV